jgi:alkaline phosphatase
MNNRNFRLALLAAVWLCLPLAVFAQSGDTGIRSVILLIPDGMSVDGVALARWYQGGAPLAMDALACGLVRTYSADAPIADSAPAATAMATGYKSHTGYIGVLPDVADMRASVRSSRARSSGPWPRCWRQHGWPERPRG